MLLFQIIVASGSLALSVGPPNPHAPSMLVLAPPNQQDPNQQWSWVFAGPQAYALYNPGRDLLALAQPFPGPVQMVPAQLPLQPFNTWQVLGAEAGVIRTAFDENLNLTGNAAGQPVTAAGWLHGQPQQLWTSFCFDAKAG